MPEGTPATTPRVETKPISAKTESEKGQDNNLLARTKDRARNLGASLKERFGKSNQTPEQKIKTIADIRTQQDAILDNRGKNPQGWMDQLRATQTPASEITSQTQTAEPIGNDPSKYAEWLQQQPGEYAKNGIDINPYPTDKTIIGRLGEKIQNRWVRKAPERGMEPKQKTPDADSFIKTESPTVSRYRELMQKNWANKEMSPQAFHDAKVKAQREAFGPPKSKDSPNSTATETRQQTPAETSTSSTTSDTSPVTHAPETTTLKTSSAELADKTAQFDAIQDLYDQGRLTKEEYNKKLANLKNPLPSSNTDLAMPDATADSSAEAPKEPTNDEILKNLGVDLESEAGKTILETMNSDEKSAKEVIEQVTKAQKLNETMKQAFDAAGIRFDEKAGLEFTLGQVASAYKDELEKDADGGNAEKRSRILSILQAIVKALGTAVLASTVMAGSATLSTIGAVNRK